MIYIYEPMNTTGRQKLLDAPMGVIFGTKEGSIFRVRMGDDGGIQINKIDSADGKGLSMFPNASNSITIK